MLKCSPKLRLCLKCFFGARVGWVLLSEAKVLFEFKVRQNNGFMMIFFLIPYILMQKIKNNAVPTGTL